MNVSRLSFLAIALLLAILIGPAEGLTLVTNVKTLKQSAEDVIVTLADLLRIPQLRLLPISATFQSNGMTLILDVVDDKLAPTNADLEKVVRGLPPAAIEAAGLVTLAEVQPDEGLTETQKLFYAGMGGAGIGILVTLMILGCCRMQRKQIEKRKELDQKAKARADFKAKYPPADAEQRLWDRIHELESRTALLLAINEDDDAVRAKMTTAADQVALEVPLLHDDSSDDGVSAGGSPSNQRSRAPSKPQPTSIERTRSVMSTSSAAVGSTPVLVAKSDEEDLLDVLPSATQAQKVRAAASARGAEEAAKPLDDKAEKRRLAQKKKPWWKRSAADAMGTDHLAPELQELTATTAPKDILVEDNVVQRRVDAIEDHWLADNPLSPLNLQLKSLIRMEGSKLHGIGLFAKTFIEPDMLLFPYLRASASTNARNYTTHGKMRQRFGFDYHLRLQYYVEHPAKDWLCIAEDPTVRGWGCCINSCRSLGGQLELEANCEVVWNDSSGMEIPWIKTTATIPPLAELLLDYRVAVEF